MRLIPCITVHFAALSFVQLVGLVCVGARALGVERRELGIGSRELAGFVGWVVGFGLVWVRVGLHEIGGIYCLRYFVHRWERGGVEGGKVR